MQSRKRERSPRDFDRRKEFSSSKFSAKNNFRRTVSNKREISPAENESNSGPSHKRLYEDSRQKDLHYKRYAEPPKYQRIQEQMKKEHLNTTRSPSVEYYPQTCPRLSENDLQPQEMKSDEFSSKDFMKIISEIPTVLLLKIFNSKFDIIEITEIEELILLWDIVNKAQDILYKSLQAEPKQDMSATSESFIHCNPVVPSMSTMKQPETESNILYGINTKPNNLPITQNCQFDIGFIRDIVKNLNLSQSGTQNAPAHQNQNIPQQSQSFSQNAPAHQNQYISQQSQGASSYQSVGQIAHPHQYTHSQQSRGASSYVPYRESSGLSNSGQPNVYSVIPGLAVMKNENPGPHPYSGHQANFSPIKSNAMQNYPYRY